MEKCKRIAMPQLAKVFYSSLIFKNENSLAYDLFMVLFCCPGSCLTLTCHKMVILVDFLISQRYSFLASKNQNRNVSQHTARSKHLTFT